MSLRSAPWPDEQWQLAQSEQKAGASYAEIGRMLGQPTRSVRLKFEREALRAIRARHAVEPDRPRDKRELVSPAHPLDRPRPHQVDPARIAGGSRPRPGMTPHHPGGADQRGRGS